MGIDLDKFNEFSKSVSKALGLFDLQKKEIDKLESKIKDLERRMTINALSGHTDHTKPFGFSDNSSAKEFLHYVRSVFAQDFSALKDMNETSNIEGGYTVPVEWRDMLIMLLENYGIARGPNGVTVVPMTREELVMPKLVGGVQVYWIGEGKTIPQTQPDFGELRLIAKKLAALVPVTSELLEDSTTDIANLLMVLFAQAIAKEEDRVVFTGDISGNADPFNGIMYDPDVIQMPMASGDTSIADIDADFLSTVSTSLTPVANTNTRFYMHRTVFNIVRTLKTVDGHYIWSRPDGSDPGAIWGVPYTLVETMPTINDDAADIPFIIYGNLSHYMIGDRKQMTLARSEHVGFAQDKIFLRVLQREGMGASVPQAFINVRTAAS